MKRVLDLLWGLSASIGLMGTCVFVGLYYGGFFHWLAATTKHPLLLTLFGG